MSIKWHSEKKSINDIKPDTRNPRKIGGKKFEDLKESINKFGLAEPIVLNLDGTIIGGHARYYYSRDKGETEVDCYLPERILTKEETKELIVRLNKNIAGEWDFDKLANEFNLDELKDWGFADYELGYMGEDAVDNNPLNEWEGMPEYDSNQSRGFKVLIVHFGKEEDVKEFEKLIGQPVTEKTKYIWFPPREKEDLKSLSFETNE